jgi:hypothetical protein
MRDGEWKLACRLGYAWRKAKKELFDCEIAEMGEIVDGLGTILLRLGDALRPVAGVPAATNLRRGRADVEAAAGLLATMAGAMPAPGAGDEAPSTPPTRRRCLREGISAPPVPRPGVARNKVRFDDKVESAVGEVASTSRSPAVGEVASTSDDDGVSGAAVGEVASTSVDDGVGGAAVGEVASTSRSSAVGEVASTSVDDGVSGAAVGEVASTSVDDGVGSAAVGEEASASNLRGLRCSR